MSFVICMTDPFCSRYFPKRKSTASTVDEGRLCDQEADPSHQSTCSFASFCSHLRRASSWKGNMRRTVNMCNHTCVCSFFYPTAPLYNKQIHNLTDVASMKHQWYYKQMLGTKAAFTKNAASAIQSILCSDCQAVPLASQAIHPLFTSDIDAQSLVAGFLEGLEKSNTQHATLVAFRTPGTWATYPKRMLNSFRLSDTLHPGYLYTRTPGHPSSKRRCSAAAVAAPLRGLTAWQDAPLWRSSLEPSRTALMALVFPTHFPRLVDKNNPHFLTKKWSKRQK